MKHLQEYIFENIINIFEAAFKREDYDKHEFSYVIKVLVDIVNDKLIKFGDKNSGPFTYAKVDINDNQKQDINNALNDQTDFNNKFGDPNKFNDFFKDVNVIIYDDPEGTNKIQSRKIKSLWTVIFKGDYSGKNSAGASYGQIFESLVCYLYNYGNKGKYSNEMIQKWVEKFNVNANDPSYASWIESSKFSADLLKEHFKSDYIAYHIDANDLFDNKEDAKFKDIAKLYSGKEEIVNILGDTKYLDIYDGNKKDKWNAADIVLINKNLNEKEIIDELKGEADGKAVNIKLVEYLIYEKILPISLKKIDKNGTIYSHNIETNKEFIKDGHDISNVKIVFGKTYQNDGLTGNFIVDGEDAEIQIRKQASGNNLSLEAKLSNNKNARGGKGISVVKAALDLKDNSYYVTFKNNDELWNFFNKHFDVNLNKQQFDNLVKKYPDLKERICFKGFAGLFNMWVKQKKYKDSQNLAIEFTKFLWDSCTECPGSYYIIK